MDEAKQMTVEEALDAADQIVGFYDGDPYDLIERGCDTLEVLAAEVRRLTAALATARREGAEEMRERAANACERMVVGGCAWSEEQAIAGRALLDAAGNIRALPLDAPGGAT